MAKAGERDELLIGQTAPMAEELKRTRMEQAQPAEKPAKASMADERLHILPSEGGGNGMGSRPRPPRVGGGLNPEHDDPDAHESYYRLPRPRGDPPRRPMPNPYTPPNHLIPNNGQKC